MRNGGGAEAWVVSTVSSGGRIASAEGLLPAGGSRVDRFTLASGDAVDGSLSAHVVVGDGGGTVDGERDLAVELPPGRLTVVSAPETVAGQAGARTPVPITVRNEGGRALPCEIQVEAAGGGAGAAMTRTLVGGGEERTVEVGLDVPADVPTSAVEGRYWVLACPEETGCTQVATGFFVLRVEGLQLQVQAALDRDHAASGETVTLDALVSAPQAAAPVSLTFRAGYGSFITERPLEVTAAPQAVTVEVPVDQPGGSGARWIGPGDPGAAGDGRRAVPAAPEVIHPRRPRLLPAPGPRAPPRLQVRESGCSLTRSWMTAPVSSRKVSLLTAPSSSFFLADPRGLRWGGLFIPFLTARYPPPRMAACRGSQLPDARRGSPWPSVT